MYRLPRAKTLTPMLGDLPPDQLMFRSQVSPTLDWITLDNYRCKLGFIRETMGFPSHLLNIMSSPILGCAMREKSSYVPGIKV